MSVQSQWCNKETGNWHENLFVGNEKCEETWFAKSIDLTFTTDSCVGGMKLKECQFHKYCSTLDDVPWPNFKTIVKAKTMLRGSEVLSV